MKTLFEDIPMFLKFGPIDILGWIPKMPVLLWGTVLGIVGYLAVSKSYTHYVPRPIPCCDNPEYLQTLLNVLYEGLGVVGRIK